MEAKVLAMIGASRLSLFRVTGVQLWSSFAPAFQCFFLLLSDHLA